MARPGRKPRYDWCVMQHVYEFGAVNLADFCRQFGVDKKTVQVRRDAGTWKIYRFPTLREMSRLEFMCWRSGDLRMANSLKHEIAEITYTWKCLLDLADRATARMIAERNRTRDEHRH